MISENQSRKFCRDDISKIENYDLAIADKTQTWDLHHRLELTLDGDFALTRADLKLHDMYYNRPYYELIFLTHAEHMRMHNLAKSSEARKKMSAAHKGRTFSEEHRRKIGEANKGRTLSDETREKMSEAHKGRTLSEEHRRKLSEALKGRTSPRKGVTLSDETRRKISEAKYGKHHSEETRRKISAAAKRREAMKRESLSHRELP